jgi:pilus assembly protein CpaD
MKHQRLALAAILLPTVLVGGCGGTLNRSVDSVHQPVVSRTDYSFDVQNTGSGLASGEAQRLAGWFASLRLGYGDRVQVDDAGSPDPTALDEIAAQAQRYGLILADTAPVTAGQVAPGTIRVVVSRLTASVPGCPDYSRQYEPNFGAHTSSNYGCATNSNLAAMIARPEDLVRGQPGADVSDPMTASKPIVALRERKTAVDQPLEATATSQTGSQ